MKPAPFLRCSFISNDANAFSFQWDRFQSEVQNMLADVFKVYLWHSVSYSDTIFSLLQESKLKGPLVSMLLTLFCMLSHTRVHFENVNACLSYPWVCGMFRCLETGPSDIEI